MYRILRVLSLCGLSSGYLMAGGACDLSSEGISILPNVGTLLNLPNPLTTLGL